MSVDHTMRGLIATVRDLLAAAQRAR